jgi:hypothetical protein
MSTKDELLAERAALYAERMELSKLYNVSTNLMVEYGDDPEMYQKYYAELQGLEAITLINKDRARAVNKILKDNGWI